MIDRRSAALLVVVLTGLATLPNPAGAQGLREEALRVLSELEREEADPCGQLAAVDALLADVERGDAEAFMPVETAALREARPDLVPLCDAARETATDERTRLDELMAHCLRLAQARAFCRVRDDCAEVSQRSSRMTDFWAAAHEACPRE